MYDCADSQWKGDTLVPPARAVLATDLGGEEVKFTVTCIAATKEYPVEHLGKAGDGHGPVRHNGKLYVLGVRCADWHFSHTGRRHSPFDHTGLSGSGV